MYDTDIEDAAAIQAVADLANKAAAIEPFEISPGIIYATRNPATGQVTTFDTYAYEQRAATPPSIIRAGQVVAADSFLAYLDEWAASQAVVTDDDNQQPIGLELWADLTRFSIQAIIDGHGGWGRHRLTLAMRTTPEWDEWTAFAGQLHKQAEFAEFIEDHLSQVADPPGADLMAICQTLRGKVNVAWESSELIASGQRQLTYRETIDAKAGEKGNLAIPEILTLGLRPFEGSELYQVKARFRYRITDGGVALGVKLIETRLIQETAFGVTVAQVEAAGRGPVLMGAHGALGDTLPRTPRT